ncbi:MAG: TlpA disulfide reductase family protein [Bryobacteraceae bacterium]
MKTRTTDRLLQYLLTGALAVLAVVIWDATRNKVVGVNDTAPEFSVTAASGKTVSRSSFGGKLLVLNFWASWCGPCVQEMPTLEALHEAGKDRGLVLLGISVDKNEKSYRRFLERHKPGFLTAHDPEQRINDSYGTYRYPETYVIDASGSVLLKKIGVLDQETVKQILGMLG